MSTANHSTDLDNRGGGVRAAVAFGALSVLLFGLAYPVVGTLLGGALFPAQSVGSPIERDGTVIGSALIAQPFADARYFHPRPSAVGYNPTGAGGSNMAPSNPALRERMQADSAAVATREGVAALAIPVELISASGSGLDPHLSPAAIDVQVARVARARGIDEAAVRAVVGAHIETPWLGVFGESRVNVLTLNLALDDARP